MVEAVSVAVELRQLVQHLLGQAGHDRRLVLVLVRVLAEVEEAAARAAVMDPVEGEFRAVRRLVLPSMHNQRDQQPTVIARLGLALQDRVAPASHSSGSRRPAASLHARTSQSDAQSRLETRQAREQCFAVRTESH